MTANTEKLATRPVIEKLLRSLTPEEFQDLERSVLQDGIMDKLVVWPETAHTVMAVAP